MPLLPGGGPPGYAPKPPFDITLCEPIFPKVKEFDDSFLTQALLKRNSDLTPSPQEQSAVLNLATKVNAAIEKVIVAPDTFKAAAVEEVRQVGSFKKGTMVTKHNVADLVVVLKTLPTVEAVTALGTKIIEEIKSTEPREVLGCVSRDFGAEIAGTQAVVRLLVTTLPVHLPSLDREIHLNPELVAAHLAAVRHARWFEENASHSSIKVLVRLLRDMRARFAGLSAMNPWMIELLAHYAVLNTPNRQPLPINQAFRRCLQLLSAGLFLPGSAGIMDPCEANVRIQNTLTPQQQDQICCTAQTLLRVLCHGGYKHILGLEGSASVATEMSVWDGVVVTPLEKAYEDDDTMDAAGDASATT